MVTSIWNPFTLFCTSAICEHSSGQRPLTTISTGRGEPTPTCTSTCSTCKDVNGACDSGEEFDSSTGVGCSPDELTIVNGEQALSSRTKTAASMDKDLAFITFSFILAQRPAGCYRSRENGGGTLTYISQVPRQAES